MIELPFPPSSLSGHAKGNWRTSAPVVAKHREWARLAGDRERKRRQRGTVTGQSRDTDGTVTELPPPDKEKGTQKEITPPRTHTHETRPREAELWACPEGVDPAHWRDFLKARKRKRCVSTETAHRGVLNDLARLADDEWPPGRLVELAAAKGWASINYPDEGLRNGSHRNNVTAADQRRGPRPNPAFDMFVASSRAIASAATGAEPDFEIGAALPAYLQR